MTDQNANKHNDADRAGYWNDDYLRYWKARVEESNDGTSRTASAVVRGDSTTTSDRRYCEAIELLQIGKNDHVLELACGFGRSLSLLSNLAGHVTAVDISSAMIQAARSESTAKNVSFRVCVSEDLPFRDKSFDVVVCFAAFDAMFQAEALAEMSRVCKEGARVLITGKADNYCDDDLAGLEAEANARAKGHPNYFTDLDALVEYSCDLGFDITVQRLFLRRGDFAQGVWTEIQPLNFYEYLLVLKSVASLQSRLPVSMRTISAAVSKTYSRVNSGSF